MIITHIILLIALAYNALNGYPEARFGKYGRLKKDINLGRLGDDRKEVILPKGLIVKDVSASGADYFEPYRFKIIVTSDYTDIVDYSIDQDKYIPFYTADSKR